MRLTVVCVAILGMTAGAIVSEARAESIDLYNDFVADTPVTVETDGSFASFVEDAGYGSVILSNDPFLGDPIVIIPGAGVTLSFDYSFIDGGDTDSDEFGAYVIDFDTGLSAGADYEFFTSATSSGSESWDLSGLTGMTLGLQFQLSALPGDLGLGSTLTVSNVELTSATPVPEPASIVLLASGVLGVTAVRRRRRQR